jgi:hypothetical protein
MTGFRAAAPRSSRLLLPPVSRTFPWLKLRTVLSWLSILRGFGVAQDFLNEKMLG